MAKAGTRTNSIQNQKAALYAEARQNAYNAVKDGNDYLYVMQLLSFQHGP